MSRLRVVLIDDEDDVRVAMEQMLGVSLPDIVDVRSFGPADADAIDWSGCQVALVDLMMPGINGEDILRHLAEHHPEVYRVAWTAKDRRARDQLVADGVAHAVVAKPGFEDIITLLERVER